MLIHAAASGVGSAAVQIAHAAGARVFATASAAKVEHVRRLGTDTVVDYKTQDFAEGVAAAAAGRGVDVVSILSGCNILSAMSVRWSMAVG